MSTLTGHTPMLMSLSNELQRKTAPAPADVSIPPFLARPIPVLPRRSPPGLSLSTASTSTSRFQPIATIQPQSQAQLPPRTRARRRRSSCRCPSTAECVCPASGSSSSGSSSEQLTIGGVSARAKKVRGQRTTSQLAGPHDLTQSDDEDRTEPIPSRPRATSVLDDNKSGLSQETFVATRSSRSQTHPTIQTSSPAPTKSTTFPSSVSTKAAGTARAIGQSQVLSDLRPRKKSGELLKPSLKVRSASSSTPRVPVPPGLMISTITTADGTPLSKFHKSAPATPNSSKSVHFDTQLEHIRHFLASQKPLAVSREGSPTLSDSESDGGMAFAARQASQRAREQREMENSVVMMKLENFPARPPGCRRADGQEGEVELESVAFDSHGCALTGRVRVMNLAFDKWVAVRFTMDGWQTTSEVSAKWAETLPLPAPRPPFYRTHPGMDIFTFVIRLTDALSVLKSGTGGTLGKGQMRERKMQFALRYRVGGAEHWDNNGGGDYEVRFTREAKKCVAPVVAEDADVKPAPAHGNGRHRRATSGDPIQVALLTRKLEIVASDDSDREPAWSRPQRTFKNSSPTKGNMPYSPAAAVIAGSNEQNVPRTASPFKGRYDFSTASLRNEWAEYQVSHTAMAEYRARNTFGLGMGGRRYGAESLRLSQASRSLSPPALNLRLDLVRGSPREGSVVGSPRPILDRGEQENSSRLPSSPWQVEVSPTSPDISPSRRRHVRSYFDSWTDAHMQVGSSPVKVTCSGGPCAQLLSPVSPKGSGTATGKGPPTTAEISASATSNSSSSSSVSSGLVSHPASSEDDTVSSTPSETTESSSDGEGDSLIPSPADEYSAMSPTAFMIGGDVSPDADPEYHRMVAELCFFTGSPNPNLSSTSPSMSAAMFDDSMIRRTQSTSSVEELLSTQTPPLGWADPPVRLQQASGEATPTRSPSVDVLVSGALDRMAGASFYKCEDNASQATLVPA